MNSGASPYSQWPIGCLNAALEGARADGSTDNTDVINQMLATGRSVYFPEGAGPYCTKGMEGAPPTEYGQMIFGDGPERTKFQLIDNSGVYGSLFTNHRYETVLCDFSAYGVITGGSNRNGIGINLPNYAPLVRCERLFLQYFQTGLYNDGNDGCSLINSTVFDCYDGIVVVGNQDRFIVLATTVNGSARYGIDVIGNGAAVVKGGIWGGNTVSARAAGGGGSEIRLEDMHLETTPGQVNHILAGDNTKVIASNVRIQDGPMEGMIHFRFGIVTNAQIDSCYFTSNLASGAPRVDTNSGMVFSSTNSAQVKLYDANRVMATSDELIYPGNDLPDPANYPSGYRFRYVANDSVGDEPIYQRMKVGGKALWQPVNIFPAADPHVAGKLWANSGVVTVSSG